MNIHDYLGILTRFNGSELYLAAGAPPSVKLGDQMEIIDYDPLPQGKVQNLINPLLSPAQLQKLAEKGSLYMALHDVDGHRFRINLFKEDTDIALVARQIRTDIPTLADLQLPSMFGQLMLQKSGLILITGIAGAGKTTTAAAMIDHYNTNYSGHVVTIENPIEFLHLYKKSIINQREIGLDTASYEDALQNVIRQAPNVVVIGELRECNTLNHALSFIERGHLCVALTYAENATQALERILNFYPSNQRNNIAAELSLTLQAVIAQRMVNTTNNGITPALEILLATPMVRDLIRRQRLPHLQGVMQKSAFCGMQTFDDSLLHLYQDKIISMETALNYADNPQNLKQKLTLQKPIPEILTQFADGLEDMPVAV